MPNKTIYVSDGDLSLYQRAQELAGGNLSFAITTALRHYVDAEDARSEGFQEITVRVGTGPGRRQSFSGVLLIEWAQSTKRRTEEYRVYRSRSGKFVVHTKKSEEYVTRSGSPEAGPTSWWRSTFSSEQAWGTIPKISTLEVADTLDALEGLVPAELYALVVAIAEQPEIEQLDI